MRGRHGAHPRPGHHHLASSLIAGPAHVTADQTGNLHSSSLCFFSHSNPPSSLNSKMTVSLTSWPWSNTQDVSYPWRLRLNSYTFVTITIFRWETRTTEMFEISSAGWVLFLFPCLHHSFLGIHQDFHLTGGLMPENVLINGNIPTTSFLNFFIKNLLSQSSLSLGHRLSKFSLMTLKR